jgi:D-alanyl-D-alanine carboxypeptidase/D-alanyl-D-alanine-endopeptidase (penicillin-binding protein 4)
MMCVPAGAGVRIRHKVHRAKPLKTQIAKLLKDPAVKRAHWGIAVTKIDGKPIYVRNAGQFFQPASNAKLFTTTAALDLLGADRTFETEVVGEGAFTGTEMLKGTLTIVGSGDANLSGRELPYVPPAERPKPAPPAADPLRYLEAMADQVAATGLKRLDGDVVGDDRLFAQEGYPPDWAIDDAVWGYGAPVSALTVNDNQIKVTVTPGASPATPAMVTMNPAVPYYTVDASGLTTGAAGTGTHLQMARLPGSKVLQVFGSIAVDSPADAEEVAIADPAEYAAMALKEMLEARGVAVTGIARAEHRPQRYSRGIVEWSSEIGEQLGSEFATGQAVGECGAVFSGPGISGVRSVVMARHRSPTLLEDIVTTNKVSENLHAELLLRHLARRYSCDGYAAQGIGAVRAFLIAKAGLDPDDFVFFDGSGLSGHDLVTPGATAKLLHYASTQPWFAAWKASLPVGGEDGTLASRFASAPLKGRIFAKTGTLGEARALSGYIECASGRTVIFSIMVDNHAPHNHADESVMDRIVAAIAATN